MTPTAMCGSLASFTASQVTLAQNRGVTSAEALARLRVDIKDYYESVLSTYTGYPLGSAEGDQSPAR